MKIGEYIVIYFLGKDNKELREIWPITKIKDNKIWVKSYVDPFHRKQCRRLLKMRKCDECGGNGLDYCAQDARCSECNGKGKIKL